MATRVARMVDASVEDVYVVRVSWRRVVARFVCECVCIRERAALRRAGASVRSRDARVTRGSRSSGNANLPFAMLSRPPHSPRRRHGFDDRPCVRHVDRVSLDKIGEQRAVVRQLGVPMLLSRPKPGPRLHRTHPPMLLSRPKPGPQLLREGPAACLGQESF